MIYPLANLLFKKNGLGKTNLWLSTIVNFYHHFEIIFDIFSWGPLQKVPNSAPACRALAFSPIWSLLKRPILAAAWKILYAGIHPETTSNMGKRLESAAWAKVKVKVKTPVLCQGRLALKILKEKNPLHQTSKIQQQKICLVTTPKIQKHHHNTN